MKPSIHLINGLHITAADKRNIIAAIAFLEEKFSAFVQASPQTVPNYGAIAVKRKGSNKAYALTPRASAAGSYDVEIRETYKNDYGCERTHTIEVRVRVDGIAPLYLPNYAVPDNAPNLFSEKGMSL